METQLESLSSDGPRRVLYTRGQKAVHLANCRSSGLSGVEYARLSGVHVGNLYRWSGKARRSGPGFEDAPGAGSKPQRGPCDDEWRIGAQDQPVFLRMDLEQPVGAKAAARLMPLAAAKPAAGEGPGQKACRTQAAGLPSCALPPVTLRCGALEVEVGAAASVGQLVEVLAAIRREVLYV